MIADAIDLRILVPARLRNGMKMQVVWTDSVGSAIRSKGCYEPEVVSVFLSHIKHGQTVIDVGAHVGQYTLFAAGIGCTVHSFEPEPKTFAILSANVAQNGLARVSLNQCALAQSSHSARLFSARSDNIGATSLIPNKYTSNISTLVSCVSLDAYLADHGNPEISFIKIDVEGAEMDVLRGAKSVLSHYRPQLIVEFNEPMQAASGSSCSDIVDFLRSFGYRLWRITAGGLVPYVPQREEDEFFNVFAE
jgi:FkbM family methyltransferase